MLVTRVQKLMHQRNKLVEQLNATKAFIARVDLTIQLKAVEFKLRQDYMIY